MLSLRCRAAVWLSLLLLWMLARPSPATSAEPPPVRMVSGAACVEGEAKTDQSTAASQGVSFSARPLSVTEWEMVLDKLSPGSGGLFRGPGGRPAPFQVFLFRVENSNPQLVRLQPGNIVRLGGPNEEEHILDYTDLYQYLLGTGKTGDELGAVRDAFYDSGLILEAGKPEERLLIYRELPPSKKRKALMLLISSFQVGAETYQASLTWHYEKVK